MTEQPTNQSFYNKYRPQTFDEIKGQDTAVTILKNGIINGNTRHTLLFCGPRGTGKTSSARILARALSCEAPVDGSPCGQCHWCNVAIGSHPGIIEIDGGSSSGVAETRQIADAITTGTSLSPVRVFIIDEVQELSTKGVSALLKAIEDTPEDAYIIMCTTHPQNLPDTIRSRATRVDFTEVSSEVLGDIVRDVAQQEGLQLTDDQVSGIVLAGQGSPRDTLSNLDRVALGGGVAGGNHGSNLALAILDGNLPDALMSIADAIHESMTAPALALELMGSMRTLMMLKYRPEILSEGQRSLMEDKIADLGVSVEDAGAKALSLMPAVAHMQKVAHHSGDPRAVVESEVISMICGNDESGNSSQSPWVLSSNDTSELAREVAELKLMVQDLIDRLSSGDMALPKTEGSAKEVKADTKQDKPQGKVKEKPAQKNEIVSDSQEPDDDLDGLLERVIKTLVDVADIKGTRLARLREGRSKDMDIYIDNGDSGNDPAVVVLDKQAAFREGTSVRKLYDQSIFDFEKEIRAGLLVFIDCEDNEMEIF